jgi:hypothetical protein
MTSVKLHGMNQVKEEVISFLRINLLGEIPIDIKIIIQVGE